MNEVLSSILSTFATFAPFALLYWFLNIIEKQPHSHQKKQLKLVIIVIFALGFSGVAILGFLLQLLGMIIPSNPVIESIFANLKQELHIQDISQMLYFLGFSLWIPAIIGLILLLPRVQRRIERLIPIQASNVIHTLTLALSTLILMQLGSTLAIGFESLNAMELNEGVWSVIAQLWTQDIMLFIIACIGVGFLTRRNFKETFQRLGLGKMTGRQFLWGAFIAIGLVVAAYLLEILLAPTPLGMDQDMQEFTEKLLGPLFTTIPGIFTLGLAAAIGEEALFRGALQPRFGLFLTSVLFALVHSNYGLSLSTLIVFGVGICLGIIRIRFNTTTAMLVHATYNLCLGWISYLQTSSIILP